MAAENPSPFQREILGRLSPYIRIKSGNLQTEISHFAQELFASKCDLYLHRMDIEREIKSLEEAAAELVICAESVNAPVEGVLQRLVILSDALRAKLQCIDADPNPECEVKWL
jgi:hypothetical protein